MIESDPAADPSGGEEEPTEAQALRGDIAETRQELGDTVEALAQKADVKAQVSEKREEAKERIRSQVAGAQAKVTQAPPVQQAAQRPWIPAAAAGALVLLLLIRRRRS